QVALPPLLARMTSGPWGPDIRPRRRGRGPGGPGSVPSPGLQWLGHQCRKEMGMANSMHITASVFVNDEAGLHHDFAPRLERLAPFNPDPNVYHHNRTGEDNADAHLKRHVMGREAVVAVTKGKPDIGPLEQIFYGKFDCHRPNRVLVKVIGQ